MSQAARVRSIAVGSVAVAVVATCVPMMTFAMGPQRALVARALESLAPVPAQAILRTPAIPLAGQAAPTRTPA